MKVFITGGAGYIGSHTCVELLDRNYEIVVADNFSNSCAEAIERVKRITGKDFPFYKADVCNEEALDKIFSEHKFDSIIHFAGLKAVGESVSMPVEYYENNLLSTLSLCKCMKKHGVNNIVFSSSATVYRSDNPMPLNEDSNLGCTNPYGWTKFMCEQILKDTSFSTPNMSVVLLRYFNPVGAHKSGLIGESPLGIPNNLMPFISQTACGKREFLSVFGKDYDTEDGTGVRDFIHVVDLALGHIAAIEYCASNNGTEVVNLGTGVGTSVLQLVDAFKRVNNIDVPYRFAERRPGDIATCYADPAKAETVLKWCAEKNIDDMCRDTWLFQSNNPNGYES